MELVRGTGGAWAAWTPAFTGFSADPTGHTARYTRTGNLVTAAYTWNAGGTSNATGFTITLPVVAANTVPQHGICRAYDNGSYVTIGTIATRANSAVADVYPDAAGGNWTGSGTKNCHFVFTYEAA